MSYEDASLQYITDADGHQTAVIVPIELWNELQENNSEDRNDTEYLNRSPAMIQRLEEAMGRKDGISLDEAKRQLGL